MSAQHLHYRTTDQHLLYLTNYKRLHIQQQESRITQSKRLTLHPAVVFGLLVLCNACNALLALLTPPMRHLQCLSEAMPGFKYPVLCLHHCCCTLLYNNLSGRATAAAEQLAAALLGP
jgi:hypothetical protein